MTKSNALFEEISHQTHVKKYAHYDRNWAAEAWESL